MSGDDPRVATALRVAHAFWQRGVRNGPLPDEQDARDLLARLDAAAPARDDALDRWLDGEIAEELGRLTRVVNPLREERIRVLREVRDRLGATTNTTPEEDNDERA